MLAPLRPDDAYLQELQQAREDPDIYGGLPTRTDCPTGSAGVDRPGHVRPARTCVPHASPK
jgi:hypothetical protein